VRLKKEFREKVVNGINNQLVMQALRTKPIAKHGSFRPLAEHLVSVAEYTAKQMADKGEERSIIEWLCIMLGDDIAKILKEMEYNELHD